MNTTPAMSVLCFGRKEAFRVSMYACNEARSWLFCAVGGTDERGVMKKTPKQELTLNLLI